MGKRTKETTLLRLVGFFLFLFIKTAQLFTHKKRRRAFQCSVQESNSKKRREEKKVLLSAAGKFCGGKSSGGFEKWNRRGRRRRRAPDLPNVGNDSVCQTACAEPLVLSGSENPFSSSSSFAFLFINSVRNLQDEEKEKNDRWEP